MFLEHKPGYGAGRHAHRDRLKGHRRGDLPGRQEFEALLPGYAERTGSV